MRFLCSIGPSGGAATVLTYLAGLTAGLIAGYSRTLLDPLIMRGVDVVLSFPALIIIGIFGVLPLIIILAAYSRRVTIPLALPHLPRFSRKIVLGNVPRSCGSVAAI